MLIQLFSHAPKCAGSLQLYTHVSDGQRFDIFHSIKMQGTRPPPMATFTSSSIYSPVVCRPLLPLSLSHIVQVVM